MIDIHKIKIFHYVYRLRSFSDASKALFISQPTVSEHIKTLENELGVSLFDRSGRHVFPTESAHVFYSYAERILSLIDEAVEAVKPEKRKFQGEIFMGGSTIPGEYILPALFTRFKKEYQDIHIHLYIEDTTQIIRMLEESAICLAVVGALVKSKKINYIPFMKDRLILVAKGDFHENGEITKKNLFRLPFIFREKGSGTRITLEKALKLYGTPAEAIHPVSILGSSDAVKSGIKAGLGLSFISDLAVKEELLNGTLKELHVQGLHIERQFYIALRKGRTLPENCKQFLGFLQTRKEIQ